MKNPLHWTAAAMLAVILATAGCATRTLEARKKEKAEAYAALSPEHREMADKGQIQTGMPMDAVYIAWGAPADVLTSEDQSGKVVTWLYEGTYMQQNRYWNYRESRHPHGGFLERYLDTEYNPRQFIRAEIQFVDGRVKSWRTLPYPR